MKQEQKIQIFSYIAADAKHIDATRFSNFVAFPAAVTKKYKDKNQNEVENTTWYDVVTSKEKLAEMLLKYATKGRPVYIEGDLELVAYTSKSGEAKAKIQVNLEKIKFLDSASKDEQQEQANANDLSKKQYVSMMNTSANISSDPLLDDDIPF